MNEEEDQEIRQQKYYKYGYFTNNQIITEVNKKLSKLPATKIEFEIMQCTKCNARGDPRFIFADCHATSTWRHTSSCDVK